MELGKPEVVITSFEQEEVAKVLHRLDEISSQFGPNQAILIRIDSFGGCIYGLSDIYETLKTMRNPIATYTKSKAMSAGAIVLACCASEGMRFASPNSSIMLHELSASSFGNIQDIENETNMINKSNKKWMNILAKSMGLKSAKDIRKLILEKGNGRDLYLSAEEAQALGAVDKVGYVDMNMVYGYEFTVK